MRKIWNLLGDNWLLIIAAIAIIIVSEATKAETMENYFAKKHTESQSVIVARINAKLLLDRSSCKQQYQNLGGTLSTELRVIRGKSLAFVFGSEVITFRDHGPTMKYLTNSAVAAGAFGVRFPDNTYEIILPRKAFDCSVVSVNNP
jgi:hypothetical protein